MNVPNSLDQILSGLQLSRIQKKFTHIKSTTIFRFLWLNYTNFYNFYKNSNFHLYSRNRCLCLSSHALAVTFSTYITWRKSLCQFPSKERVFFPTALAIFSCPEALVPAHVAEERGTLFNRLQSCFYFSYWLLSILRL